MLDAPPACAEPPTSKSESVLRMTQAASRIQKRGQAASQASHPRVRIGQEAAVEAARRKLADSDGRLVKYRAALDNGADPTVVAEWIAEVQGDRLAAERILATSRASLLTAEDVREEVEGLGDVVAVLAKAKPTEKAKLYADLGITRTWGPPRTSCRSRRRRPCAKVRVGGPMVPLRTPSRVVCVLALSSR
jgi:hypothetical protein